MFLPGRTVPALTGILFAIIFTGISSLSCNTQISVVSQKDSASQQLWYGWNHYQLKPEDTLARLGYDIIVNTYKYFGPEGKVAPVTNGMNCQNCHIDGGIRPWGNNFGAVIISYPRFSGRDGDTLSLTGRINSCFERSLNGKAIDTNSYEMKAMIAYMRWLAGDVKKKPSGTGVMKLPYLDRAADTLKGKIVFDNNCERCHGKDGEGLPNGKGGFTYPPLWGDKSYNTGAGMYRLSLLAGFVKNNMPFDEASYNHTVLTEEEAWDVAAYINSKPRPLIKGKHDYPDISKKEVDAPFGPYSDTFSEKQHKYGPFKAIADAHSSLK
ncbi:MAG TPA: c-type cytochrome [Chitinophagaceae bacterium]|nr:c-type cytochrome [Chitinophagaceae bacterium]